MILHLKHYAHAPNDDAIASRGFALRRFRVGPHERRQKIASSAARAPPNGKTSGYISVVSLEVVTP